MSYKLNTWESVIFEQKLKNIHEVLLLKGILIRKKILWKINFFVIKFLSNALLFGNKCKNTSFLHKIMCISVDYAGAIVQFTFMACTCNYKGLWLLALLPQWDSCVTSHWSVRYIVSVSAGFTNCCSSAHPRDQLHGGNYNDDTGMGGRKSVHRL